MACGFPRMVGMDRMKKLKHGLAVGAVLFVLIYLWGIVITIRSRIEIADHPAEIASTLPHEAERHLAFPELFLPMGILLALAAGYLVVKRRQSKTYDQLDDDVDEED